MLASHSVWLNSSWSQLAVRGETFNVFFLLFVVLFCETCHTPAASMLMSQTAAAVYKLTATFFFRLCSLARLFKQRLYLSSLHVRTCWTGSLMLKLEVYFKMDEQDFGPELLAIQLPCRGRISDSFSKYFSSWLFLIHKIWRYSSCFCFMSEKQSITLTR